MADPFRIGFTNNAISPSWPRRTQRSQTCKLGVGNGAAHGSIRLKLFWHAPEFARRRRGTTDMGLTALHVRVVQTTRQTWPTRTRSTGRRFSSTATNCGGAFDTRSACVFCWAFTPVKHAGVYLRRRSRQVADMAATSMFVKVVAVEAKGTKSALRGVKKK